jgi:hypothetical protein
LCEWVEIIEEWDAEVGMEACGEVGADGGRGRLRGLIPVLVLRHFTQERFETFPGALAGDADRRALGD